MTFIALYLYNLFGATLAATVGAFRFKYLKTPFKLLFVQALLNWAIETIGFLVTAIPKWDRFKYILPPMYNCKLFIEVSLFYLIAYLLLLKYKTFFITSYICFTTFWTSSLIFRDGFLQLDNISYTLESILMVVAYIILLYTVAMNAAQPVRRNPAFLLSIGMIVFYGCNVPYFSLFHQLKNIFSSNEIAFIRGRIIIILDNFNYILIAISFFLIDRKKMQKKFLLE